jgi:hypothetical protein
MLLLLSFAFAWGFARPSLGSFNEIGEDALAHR